MLLESNTFYDEQKEIMVNKLRSYPFGETRVVCCPGGQGSMTYIKKDEDGKYTFHYSYDEQYTDYRDLNRFLDGITDAQIEAIYDDPYNKQRFETNDINAVYTMSVIDYVALIAIPLIMICGIILCMWLMIKQKKCDDSLKSKSQNNLNV